MAVKRSRSSRLCLGPAEELVDLYDYARPEPLRSKWQRHDDEPPIVVTDDWPEMVPISEAELRTVEAHLADILDAIFGPLP
jgi:hypothetical protein